MGRIGVDLYPLQAGAGLQDVTTFGKWPDDFPLCFYRWPKAPDLEIFNAELDLDAIRQAGVPPVPVYVVNGLGAIMAGRLACSGAMPLAAEVEARLESGPLEGSHA
jgi:hypothetical protein